MKLRKDISNLSLLMTAVGGIIGSGWLLGPLYVAQSAGPAAVLSWVIGGCLMMLIAFTFAELSTAFPVAGSLVRYAQFSHGTLSSFTMAWISWLAALMVAPIETMAALQYAGNYFPSLMHIQHGSHSLSGLGVAVAAMAMLLMCGINQFGVKFFAKSNTWIVFWKITIPIITAIILLRHKFDIHNFIRSSINREGFAPYGLKGILAALPTAGVVFSFIGYSPAIQLAGEAKNPSRAIPVAIIGSICFAILLYVLIQTAFIGVMTPASFSHGWAHLSFSGDAGPIAGLIASFGMVWFLKVIYVDACISPAGTAFIYTASTARINIAMSQNGYMPEIMQKLNRYGSPWAAIVLNFIVGMMLFLPFPGWQSMVSFLVSCFVVAYAVGPISCITLRHTMPDVKRPFKVPFVYASCFLAFYVCNLIIYWTGWQVIWKMLIVVLVGYVFLFGHMAWERARKRAIKNRDVSEATSLDFAKGKWLFPYFIGIGILSYLGQFGGDHLIGFGWDFVAIAAFSYVIYVYATRLGINAGR